MDSNEGGDLILYKQYSLEDVPGKEETVADGSRSSPRDIEGGKNLFFCVSLFILCIFTDLQKKKTMK